VFRLTRFSLSPHCDHLPVSDSPDSLSPQNDETAVKKVEVNREYDVNDDGTPVTPENYQLWWESYGT